MNIQNWHRKLNKAWKKKLVLKKKKKQTNKQTNKKKTCLEQFASRSFPDFWFSISVQNKETKEARTASLMCVCVFFSDVTGWLLGPLRLSANQMNENER